METMTVTSVESYSANSSYGTGSPTLARTLAIAIALASLTVLPAAQENIDATIRVAPHHDVAQSSAVTRTQSPQERWARLRNKISAFRTLSHNWDGDGTVPPKPEYVDALLHALTQLPHSMRLPKPLLSGDGEIGVYWSKGEAFADLTIDSDGDMSLYLRNLNEEGGSLVTIAAPYKLDEGIVATLAQHLA